MSTATHKEHRALLTTIAGISIVLMLASCGSTSTASASDQASCREVADVLSDGPDPGVDPLGYAQAQILPLGQIRTADPKLRAAIGALASAYQIYSAPNAANHSAKTLVAGAIARVNAICPGAAS